MGLFLQDCSQKLLRDERLAMFRSKHATLERNRFFGQLPRSVVEAKSLIDSAHGDHQPRLEIRLRCEIGIDSTSTTIENFACGDFVAPRLIGICNFKGADQKI